MAIMKKTLRESGVVADNSLSQAATSLKEGETLSYNPQSKKWEAREVQLPGGWKDCSVSFNTGKSAADSPDWKDIGNGIYAWHFDDRRSEGIHLSFHATQDYEVGTKVYPHIHWMPMSNSTGSVVWKMKYTIAKGYGQGEALTGDVDTIEISQHANGISGEHLVVETSENQAFQVPEAGSVVMMHVYRDGMNPNDTFVGDVVGISINLDYYSKRVSNPNKHSPNNPHNNH